MNYSEIAIGDNFEVSFTVSDEKVREFAKTTGDDNPLHVDDDFAAKSQFGKRIAHGMLVASFISKVIGRDFPGDGTIYVSQEVRFKRPVFVGDTVSVHIEVFDKNDEKKRLFLKTDVLNEKGKTVIEGEAEVLRP